MASTLEMMVGYAQHALEKGLDSQFGREALATALLLNPGDWLNSRGYTIAEALRRPEPEAIAFISTAADVIAAAQDAIENARNHKSERRR